MSGFHRCVTCQAKLPASDPHDDCVTCLGPEYAASVLADRAFCHLCAGFQTRTLHQRAKKAGGGHSTSSGSSHTISAPPSSTATPPGRLQLSRSPSSQLTAGQRSPTRRARERSPSPHRVRPRRESRSHSRSPRRRGRSHSPRRDKRYRDRSEVAELTSKMSQFMEIMIGQQSILMSLANVVPRVPEQPAGPIASQPAAPPQPAPVVAPPVQSQGAWDFDAVSRDASDVLEGESIEAEVASQHSEQDIELEVLDTDDPTWSVVKRATSHLGIEWPMAELPRRSLFESASAQPHQSRMLPAFPDFVKEVQSTWGAFSMQGASEAGLESFRPVDAEFAALVKTPTLSGLTKDPACPNKQCRTTEKRVGVSQLLLVKLAQLNAWAHGRSIASLVVARRQLWLSQARVQEPGKAPLLDAPNHTGAHIWPGGGRDAATLRQGAGGVAANGENVAK
ncbi:UNVERIFIED_CONTAM: hypothetical protein FKN15_003989 [Acipenser sinensis]